MKSARITAVYTTRDGDTVSTGFRSIKDAEQWRGAMDRTYPGWIAEWSIDTRPYEHPEVFHLIRSAEVSR
jgi:hypothetical protein